MTLSKQLRPRVVALGTAGGPKWWKSRAGVRRAGIATAVVVGEKFYLVDCGRGVGGQLSHAGLDLANMRGIFLTHLHSDHTVDLAGLAIFGLYEMLERTDDPVPIIGPGNRGMLPIASPRAAIPPTPLAPNSPTPGTREMFELLMAAHATDLNDRIIDSLRPSPLELFNASDIEIPGGIGYHPNDCPTPTMEPFDIYEDDLVTVSAILVEHPPIAPAFGFRFETEGGSVTFSGDTTYTPNMATLARGTDLLFHEAIDFDWVEAVYANKADAASRASRDHHYKSHTSVRDAAKLASEAGAGQLALHHLVPGSAPDATWQQDADLFAGPFHVPNDLDSIRLRP
ncbi:MBL fold metallo-hydrolase [Spelaeicoccus albus]|uniref:Ribonuclease BN (tRNA processing enzyme) n=1 Tax=Spelaeicoccus albus TaxID=1280376 RepID=A0A7Z0D019_9MICO|nr:MBL fold metallo-hydrolase [Spelaeicoccus albus]NYI66911.1 ribonuclease BN (tRNA processing enzyme) [Spelaeicoccus albus]